MNIPVLLSRLLDHLVYLDQSKTELRQTLHSFLGLFCVPEICVLTTNFSYNHVSFKRHSN